MNNTGERVEVFEHEFYRIEHRSFGECEEDVFETFEEAYESLLKHGKSAGYFQVVKIKQTTIKTIYVTDNRKLRREGWYYDTSRSIWEINTVTP